jgi:hypothetical protein
MSEDAPIVQAVEPVTLICPECGEAFEFRDPAAILRALHLANACPGTEAIAPR